MTGQRTLVEAAPERRTLVRPKMRRTSSVCRRCGPSATARGEGGQSNRVHTGPQHVGSFRADHAPWREEPAVKWSIPCRAVAACATAIAFTSAAGVPTGHAKNGDTHITGEGLEQTIDCNGATLLVDGTRNTVNALGTCWAVTVMGTGHTVVADNVVDRKSTRLNSS